MEARLKAGPSPCAMACNQIWGIPVIEPARPAWRSRVVWSAPECKYIEAAQVAFKFPPYLNLFNLLLCQCLQDFKEKLDFKPTITCIFCICCSVRSWGREWQSVKKKTFHLHSTEGSLNSLHPGQLLQILDPLLDGNTSQLLRNPLQALHPLLQPKRHLCKWRR